MRQDFLDQLERGQYFTKKTYDGKALFSYEEVRDKLPRIYYDAKKNWIECYDYAVQLLFKNMHRPREGSGFVSNFVDAAFNEDIFLWDTVFMTLFCNILHPYVPGICSLDNFYCKQFEDGEIPRELVRDTGKDFPLWVNRYGKPLHSYFHNHYGYRRLKEMQDLSYENMYRPDMGRVIEKSPYLTMDNLNHPLLAFAEWESFCHTKDRERLSEVSEALYQYYRAFQYHLQHACGLYVTDWASMDNSPRNKELGLAVDTSCEMVLFGNYLLSIMDEIAKTQEEVQKRRNEIEEDIRILKKRINRWMWDEETGFYYDLTMDKKKIKIKTAAAFWALLSGVADEEKAKRLAAWLDDTSAFNRVHRVPALAADEADYDPRGGYWRGAVWSPINAMVVLGLEHCKKHAQAKEIALNHLENVSKVWEMTGTIWENYSADFVSEGNAAKKDFVGWSGLAPVLYLIQYAVGLSVEKETGDLCWELDKKALEKGFVGCDRYWFRGITTSLLAQKKNEQVEISVKSDKPFCLHIIMGKQKWIKDIPGEKRIVFTIGEKT